MVDASGAHALNRVVEVEAILSCQKGVRVPPALIPLQGLCVDTVNILFLGFT